MFESVAEHLERLTALSVSEVRREPAEELASWATARLRAGKPASVIVVCTGNSRRSMLGSLMGNAAASRQGLLGLRFFSGGTDPTAFNPRTIAALTAIGFEIEACSDHDGKNPVYQVRWGTGQAFETTEFSKHYADPANPQTDFAALMVCDEADAGCPLVAGASLRISLPFEDPKVFDGSERESLAYAERRDEIGRWMAFTAARIRDLCQGV